MKAVELKNVTFSYEQNIKVLDKVCFFAEYGQLALIAGHSGDGKSTLLSVISGIIPNVINGSLSGEVFINGESTNGKKLGEICRKVGVVLQNADEQIIQKKVEDEIAFGCENIALPADKIKSQIDTVCGIFSLKPFWNCRDLSGGQKQRLITASTLAMGQKIIILDEPLANLDKEGAQDLMETLRTLTKSGYCVIVVEHRLDVVLPYVDRVWHIGGGKVVEIPNKQEYIISQTKLIPDICKPFKPLQTLLSLNSVSFSIKKRQYEILKNITCEIKSGERIVLLGDNGCGKTTLLRLIARLYKPSSGKIIQYIDDKFTQKPKCEKGWFKKVGVVYQNPDYQLFMPTVRQEIAFGAYSDSYAEYIINLFGLQNISERHPQSLSQGQKRKVSIAAVAACKPSLLLLDEPTVGQDYTCLKELVNIINQLHEKSGNTVITVTHDVRCAESLCDKAFVISNGVIQESGGKDIVRHYFDVKR